MTYRELSPWGLRKMGLQMLKANGGKDGIIAKMMAGTPTLTWRDAYELYLDWHEAIFGGFA
jgi:hypothetical protein